MLTELDDRVLASINLHAVFGALPRLTELVPEAYTLLTGLDVAVTLTLSLARGDQTRLVFRKDGIVAEGQPAGARARLRFRSPAHLNAVVAGMAQPIPIAGFRGLRFLTGVFTPLTCLLGRYLQPDPDDLSDPAFAEASTLLTLHVAATAITVVANEDRAGRFSAAQMSDGDLTIGVGNDLSYRIGVRNHRLRLVPPVQHAPRATFAFADLATAGDVLARRESALACVCDGRITIRGYIPLIDNTSRILDRVGQYLGR